MGAAAVLLTAALNTAILTCLLVATAAEATVTERATATEQTDVVERVTIMEQAAVMEQKAAREVLAMIIATAKATVSTPVIFLRE